MAAALTTRPLHVDQVASAIVRAIQDDSIKGVVNVQHMRHILGIESVETHIT
jgi:nucleoside-diphosphate-sugar epimerase